MNGFGMKESTCIYGMRATEPMGMHSTEEMDGMVCEDRSPSCRVWSLGVSCWVECFVRGDDSYGYGFALWSPYGYTDGDVLRNGRKIPMMRELTRGCTVSFTVTPTMNGEEMPIDEGSIQFILKGAEGVQVEASSSDGHIEITAEQMDIPVGKYAWAVRWVRSGSVHMLGTGRLDVTKNIFMED